MSSLTVNIGPEKPPRIPKIYIRDNLVAVLHLFEHNKIIRTIPKHKFNPKFNEGEWEFPLTEIDDVLRKLAEYSVDPTVTAYLKQRDMERAAIEAANSDFDDNALDTTEEYNPLLKTHQKKVLHIIKSNDIKRYGLFLDTGTGKTFTALELIKMINPKRCLVVCPLSLVRSVWLNEAKKWHPEMDVKAVWDPSTNARSLYSLTEIMKRQGQVNIITFATFRNIVENLVAIQEVDPIYDMIIVDESSIMKDPSSKTTKALLAFGETVEYAFILSGCPAPNSPEEYFSQIRLINPNILGKSHQAFIHKYTEPVWGGRPVFTDKKLRELMQEIARVAIVIKKEDCLDLPEHSIVTRDIVMNKKQAETYKQLLDGLVSKLDESVAVIPKNILARIMKLRQITSGFVRPTDLYEDEDTSVQDIEDLDKILKSLGIRPIGQAAPGSREMPEIFDLSDAKCEEVISILQDELPKEPVVIWLQFTYEFEKLGKFLDKAGIAYHAFHGATKKWDMERMEDEFKSGKVRVLLAHPRSVAHGHTWTHCAYDIVMSLSYSYEEWKQSKDRLHRMGQTRPCTRIVLTSIFESGQPTVDKLLLEVVEDKKDLDALATDMLKGRWQE